MRRSTSIAIFLLLSAALIFAPGNIFGATPERSIYSQVTSDQSDFVATPPPELRGFWDGMKQEWFANGWMKINSYCRQYAKGHPNAIRDIMKDGLGESETKEMVYSLVVSKLDQEQSVPVLKFYVNKGTEPQKSMANDFLADIEEINRDAAFPQGDQYPDNRLPVTDSPPELRELWKGIDKQWIGTWAKTGPAFPITAGSTRKPIQKDRRLSTWRRIWSRILPMFAILFTRV